MTFRLLIDECLSPALAQMAVAAGHVESTCVRNRGWAGTKDWQRIDFIVANDYTLVTHNSVDFRGQGPGNLGGEHAKQPIHAGLICLNSALVMGLVRRLGQRLQLGFDLLDQGHQTGVNGRPITGVHVF